MEMSPRMTTRHVEDPAGPREYRLRSSTGASTGVRSVNRAEASIWFHDMKRKYPYLTWTLEFRGGGRWHSITAYE